MFERILSRAGLETRTTMGQRLTHRATGAPRIMNKKFKTKISLVFAQNNNPIRSLKISNFQQSGHLFLKFVFTIKSI